MFDKWTKAGNRILLLDYDGTLVPFASLPSEAKPSPELLETLEKLATDNKNTIFIISGRDSKTLENWLGHLPLNIIAEHGAKLKLNSKGWEREKDAKNDWKGEAYLIMDEYVKKCDRAFIEEKDFSLAWHYRNASTTKIKHLSKELFDKLSEYAASRELQVIPGNKVIEIRNKGINKGVAAVKMLGKQDYDFIMAIGDDRTDEDMFAALTNNSKSYTIKVGNDASQAMYKLYTPYMVLSLLEMLGNMAN